MNVTDVLEEVVDDVVVDASKQMRDPKTFRGVIAGGEHVVLGPRVWHHARFVRFREVRMLVNVGAQSTTVMVKLAQNCRMTKPSATVPNDIPVTCHGSTTMRAT